MYHIAFLGRSFTDAARTSGGFGGGGLGGGGFGGGGVGSGIRSAYDVLLHSVADVLDFIGAFWSMLPPVVQAMIYISFGLLIIIGLIKMLF